METLKLLWIICLIVHAIGALIFMYQGDYVQAEISVLWCAVISLYFEREIDDDY